MLGTGLLERRHHSEVDETGKFGLGRMERRRCVDFAKSPEQRARASQHNRLAFKVKVYPNVQCACLTSNYSAGNPIVSQCSTLSTSMALPIPTASPADSVRYGYADCLSAWYEVPRPGCACSP